MKNILNYLLIGIGLRTKYTLPVKRGIKLLNAKVPGWRVALGKKPISGTEMADMTACVLGRISGGNRDDIDAFRTSLGFTSWADSTVAGFSIPPIDWSDAWEQNYLLLGKEWNKQLGLK